MLKRKLENWNLEKWGDGKEKEEEETIGINKNKNCKNEIQYIVTNIAIEK